MPRTSPLSNPDIVPDPYPVYAELAKANIDFAFKLCKTREELAAVGGDADVIWVFELYSDQDSLSAHGTSDKMKEVGATLGDLVAGRAELSFLEPVGGKGVAL